MARLVAFHLTDEFRAGGSQGSDDGVDIVGFECHIADARSVRRRVPAPNARDATGQCGGGG